MKRIAIFLGFLCAIVLTARFVSAQVSGPDPNAPPGGTIVKLDPALDKLIAPDAKLEVLRENYWTAVEGDAWVKRGKDGYLIFSEVNKNEIIRWDPGCEKNFPCPIASGKDSVLMEHAGYTQAELNAGKISVPDHEGTVGLETDPQGRIVSADYGEHGIVRYEKDGSRTLLAGTYEGKKFACPNKLVVKKDGAIYFTDPVTICIKGGDQSPEHEISYHGLYLIKDGRVTLLAKDPQGGAPHGITMSPDEKILYIGAGKKILAYDIKSDDSIENERVFHDFSNEGRAGVDGVNIDSKGNLWGAGGTGITIFSPQGKQLGTIAVPQVQGVRFANLAFGDPDRKTLYIVGNKNLWRIRLKVAGVRS